MPFRALIRTVNNDGNLKVGLDELALYFLRNRGWLKKPQFDANGNPLETVHEHHDGEDCHTDEEDRDISYAEMVAGTLDDMLMGVWDDVVGLLPRRGAMDLGYSQDAYVHPVSNEGSVDGGSGSRCSNDLDSDWDKELPLLDEQDLSSDSYSVANRDSRRVWHRLGMVGAAALGFLASTLTA